MRSLARLLVVLAISILVSSLAACSSSQFSGPEVLGGVEVSADTLNAGHEAYNFYCLACHGPTGDGRGPASAGLTPPPRDFRIATFKFAGFVEGELPPDENLMRVVRHGLEGTAMLPWQIPDPVLHDILQYVKSLSAPGYGWREPENTIGEAVAMEADPWGDARKQEAIDRGRAVYHGMATCQQCHAAYETPDEMNAHLVEFGKTAIPPRDQFWLSQPRESAILSAAEPGENRTCKADADCGANTHLCRFERCERKLMIVPPDFTFNSIRTGTDLTSLFRIIATGIPGTAMPPWKDSLPDADLWAMAYYVQHLAEMRGTPQMAQLKARVSGQAR